MVFGVICAFGNTFIEIRQSVLVLSIMMLGRDILYGKSEKSLPQEHTDVANL